MTRSKSVQDSLDVFEELGSIVFRDLVDRADFVMLQFKLKIASGQIDTAFIGDADDLHFVLNRLEFRSLQIAHGVADIDVAKEHYRRTLQDYWDRYYEYVEWFREVKNQPGAYTAFETVSRHLMDHE